MKASELLSGIPGRLVSGNLDVEISRITDDSRKCMPGSMFFALVGESADGHDFVKDAVFRGARVVVVERAVEGMQAAVFMVDSTRDAACRVLRRFYNFVDGKLFKVAVTGTNGKSTVAYIVKQFLDRVGKPCAFLGTTGYEIGKDVLRAPNTTPGLFLLWELMDMAFSSGCKALSMEVSSHALKQGRLGDLCFDVSIFTNLSRDHLDYHGSMEEYFRCKSLLFERHTKGVSVINVDDAYGRRLLEGLSSCVTYGTSRDAQVRFRLVDCGLWGMLFELDGIRVKTPLVGVHNLYNLAAAYCVALHLGMGGEFVEFIGDLRAPKGRLERVEGGRKVVFVDYAHTPDALERVLSALREITPGRLIVVFGCGGNRDRGKRPLMGKVATEIADYAVITSDNPRDEEPEAIVGDILKGVQGDSFEVVLDRREAIFKAVAMAGEEDVVLVAGKGHEDYQIVRGKRLHFDDVEVVREALEADGLCNRR